MFFFFFFLVSLFFALYLIEGWGKKALTGG